MRPNIIQMDAQTWFFDEGGVRFFLLTGDKEALLIDSGMETQNARELAQSLTKLPIRLLNTHADIDHVGSNHQFDAPYMHPAECSNYYHGRPGQPAPERGAITPVWDGQVIDLGERPLEIIALPGHTPGSIAVLDVKNRILISGDPIQDGGIYMFGIQREAHAYRHSLKRLMERHLDRFDAIWPSHGTLPVAPSLIEALYSAMGRILAGEAAYKLTQVHGMTVRRYDMGVAGFLMDEKQKGCDLL